MSTVFDAIGTLFSFFVTQLGSIVGVIMDNYILLIPVLFALFTSLVFFGVKVIKKLGVRSRR